MALPYEAAIRITGTDNFSGMFAALTSAIAGSNIAVKALEKSVAALKPAALGAVGAIAGFEGLKVVARIAEHGEKLLDQQDKLRRSGIAQLDVLRMQANFYDKIATSIPTANAAEYLKTVNELRAVTGSIAGAEKLAPKAMMVDAVLSNTFGKDMQGEYYKLLRSAEMKGIATNPEKLADFTDRAFSYITAFGGKLTAQDYQTFARRGGSAFINADVDKAMGPLSVLMADLGGSGAGTAAMTLQQLQLGATTLSKQQAEIMKQAGLLDMSKVTATGFGGGRLQLGPGAVAGSTEFTGDLPGWIQNVVMPHLRQMAGGDDKVLQSLLSKMFPNRNGLKLAMMFGEPGFEDQIRKDLGLAAQVKPIPEAYDSFTQNNPVAVKKAFWEQEESMMQAIGSPLMQAAIPVMKALTQFFTDLGSFANAHPTAIAALGISVASVAGALAVLGSAAVIGAMAAFVGPAAALAGGITALGIAASTAYLAFSKEDWATIGSKVSAGLKAASDALLNFARGMGDDLKKVFGWAFDGIKASLSGFFARFPSWEGIITGLKNAFAGLFDWLKEKINWLGSFIPGWKDIKGNASEIPGMKEHLASWGHGGGDGGDASYSPSGASTGTSAGGGSYGASHHAIHRALRAATGVGGSSANSIMGDPSNIAALRETAARVGTTAENLATVIGYETEGSFSPSKWGGLGGRYMGLIQFGPNERAQYGANASQSFKEQLGAVERYLKGRGFKAGMGLMDLYSTVLAGSPGHYNAHDINGSIRSHVARMVNQWSARVGQYLHGSDAGLHGAALRHMFGHPHQNRESAIPPARGQQPEHTTSIHMDGRVVAHLVERQMVKKHRFAHGTADHDGRAGVPHVDYMSIA